MVYASVSRSFNSGFYNQSNFGGFANEIQNPPVSPDFLTVYDVGGKTEFFHRRLRFNLSRYFSTYDDLPNPFSAQRPPTTTNARLATTTDIRIVTRSGQDRVGR